MISQIAKTIDEQIGRRAYFMMGARNVLAGESWVSFRTGRVAAGKANYVKVTYNHGTDLYDLEFLKLHGKTAKPIATETGIYAEDMHSRIEEHTGLATRL